MTSAMSYELFNSKLGVANGVATLDGSGLIPESQLPPGSVETWKGVYATSAALIAAHPVGQAGWYAYVTATLSQWAWNFTLNSWEDINITEADYALLSATEKATIVPPYVVIP